MCARYHQVTPDNAVGWAAARRHRVKIETRKFWDRISQTDKKKRSRALDRRDKYQTRSSSSMSITISSLKQKSTPSSTSSTVSPPILQMTHKFEVISIQLTILDRILLRGHQRRDFFTLNRTRTSTVAALIAARLQEQTVVVELPNASTTHPPRHRQTVAAAVRRSWSHLAASHLTARSVDLAWTQRAPARPRRADQRAEL